MPRLRRLATAFALIAIGGCGGGGEGEKVKDSLTQLASDIRTGNSQGVCDAVAPETRRILDVIAKGRAGDDAKCPDVLEEQLEGGGGLEPGAVEQVEEADVDVEGDEARVKLGDEDERVRLEKVDGTWRAALHELSPAFALRASAECTERTLQAIDSPLPPPTRRGIARDAARDAESLRAVARLLAQGRPPKGMEDERDEVVEMLEANADDWERASRALRGIRAPLNAYNRALRSTERRSGAASPAVREIRIGCLGDARTLKGATDFRQEAHRVCGVAGRRIERAPQGATLLRRLADIGRDTVRELRPLKPPPSLAKSFRAALDAFSTAYAALPKAANASDVERAAERVELLALRSSIAFFRVGLPRCAQL